MLLGSHACAHTCRCSHLSKSIPQCCTTRRCGCEDLRSPARTRTRERLHTPVLPSFPSAWQPLSYRLAPVHCSVLLGPAHPHHVPHSLPQSHRCVSTQPGPSPLIPLSFSLTHMVTHTRVADVHCHIGQFHCLLPVQADSSEAPVSFFYPPRVIYHLSTIRPSSFSVTSLPSRQQLFETHPYIPKQVTWVLSC